MRLITLMGQHTTHFFIRDNSNGAKAADALIAFGKANGYSISDSVIDRDAAQKLLASMDADHDKRVGQIIDRLPS